MRLSLAKPLVAKPFAINSQTLYKDEPLIYDGNSPDLRDLSKQDAGTGRRPDCYLLKDGPRSFHFQIPF